MAKLKVKMTGSKSGDDYSINDVPEVVWQEFQKKALKHFPDKGDLAWAAYLSECIAALVDSRFQTLIMNGIPKEAYESFKFVCDSVQTTPDQVVAMLFQKALSDLLYIVRMRGTDDKGTKLWEETEGVWVVLMNISPKAWASWEKAAQKFADDFKSKFDTEVERSPHSLIANLFQMADDGRLTLSLMEGSKLAGKQ